MEAKEQIRNILERKKQRDVIVLAHLYQPDEIQALADYTGDSLGLSRLAKEATQSIIVFCGVHFMAETAKILSPEKTVVLPVADAGCPMADMVDEEEIERMRAEHPQAAVVCYVNSTAQVKAASHYCCTSANALQLVRNIPEGEIIFVPDQNLGAYIAERVPEKTIHLASGFCPTHHRLQTDDVRRIRQEHPDVRILAHPECKPEVLERVDFIGSTSQILAEAKESDDEELIIATERGTLYRLKEENPQKRFHLLSPDLICPNMKKTTLADLLHALETLETRIEVEDDVADRARVALERMLQYS